MTRFLFAIAVTSLLAGGTALAGPDWVEGGDAGSMLNTAQPTFGVGQIHSITGSLSSGFGMADYEDMYLIRIIDPASFSLTITSSLVNTQLFLFNVTMADEAFGLLANDDSADSVAPALGPSATDATGAMVTRPGVYALAISGHGRNPISRTGLIFSIASPTEISGADGPGGLNPHSGWTGVGDTGEYNVGVTGVGFYDTPAPSAAALLALAGACAARRRR